MALADIRGGTLDIERPVLPAIEAWHLRLQDCPAYRDTIMTSYEALRESQ